MKKTLRRRVDVNVEELDRIIDDAKMAPLSEADSEKLKTALHALAERLVPRAGTERTSSVFGDADKPVPEPIPAKSAGHGRNGAAAYRGAQKIRVAHARLAHGDRCPDCTCGNVYAQKEPKALVRIVGQAPLAATVYELERLRCNACGQVFTAEEPEGVGSEKYDETASAMIAQLKYGSGIPFYRLESLEGQLEIPLPAATQWEIVEEAAEAIKPAHEELIRQAAQGEVLHNDDTGMRVLRIEREPSDERTGCSPAGSCPLVRAGTSPCTSPVVSMLVRT
jgi:transposase